MRENRERERESRARMMVNDIWRERLTTIFVGRISRNSKESDLWEVLSPSSVMVDIYNPKMKGMVRRFAFTRFQHQANLEHLLEKNHGIRIDGQVF